MAYTYKKLFFEMTVIVLLSVTIGIIWNYRLLLDVYTGKLSEVSPSLKISATPAAVLIPVGLAQVKELYEKKEAVFIDARESSVYSRGHIQGSTSLPLAALDSELQAFMEKVPYETNLVIYCSGYGCHDSTDVGNRLLQKGYRQILIFDGGYPEWKDAGLPIEGANQ